VPFREKKSIFIGSSIYQTSTWSENVHEYLLPGWGMNPAKIDCKSIVYVKPYIIVACKSEFLVSPRMVGKSARQLYGEMKVVGSALVTKKHLVNWKKIVIRVAKLIKRRSRKVDTERLSEVHSVYIAVPLCKR